MSSDGNRQPDASGAWTPPVIRQVALIMLLLCLVVPVALYLQQQRAASREHEPAKTRAAMAALFGAIELRQGEPAALPDAEALGTLMPACTRLGNHQGMPIMDDVAEQVALLDHQLAHLTAVEGVHNAPLRRRYQLDTAAWARAIGAGAIDCRHAIQALRTLAGPRGGALLSQAQWQEHTRSKGARAEMAPAHAVRMAAGSLAQTDPWRGWPGCVWLGGLQQQSAAYYVAPAGRATWGRLLCEQDGVKPAAAAKVMAAQPAPTGTVPPRDSAAWVVPKDIGVLLSELDGLRLPEGRLYENYAARLPDGSNRRVLGRTEVDVGFNIQLTIEPRTQAIAQQVAECYSGSTAACAVAGVDFSKVGAAQGPGASAMWEKAAARMTAIAVLDVATGRIEALASAHTPCYAQENDGPFRDDACPPLWTKPERRPYALLNHAVFSDYMPGSTVKPIMASVFLEDSYTNVEQLSLWLAKSNTWGFNDELFCYLAPKGRTACERPSRVQRRAADLGWNVDCAEQPSFRCGKADILFGRRLSARLEQDEPSPYDAAPLQRTVLTGRLFARVAATARGNAHKLMSMPDVDRVAAASCRDKGGQWHADNCTSAALKPLVNEAEGQGEARATALGVGAMLARLAAAANGAQQLRRPHLVAAITDAKGRQVMTAATRADGGAEPLAEAEPINVRPELAGVVLRALARGTQPLPGQDGTAHLICKHVFGARCGEAGARLAGKTGTPTFSFDSSSIGSARRHCIGSPRDGNCYDKPIKWYVAAYKSSPGPQAAYDKVIAVMSERNWYTEGPGVPKGVSGRVHGGNNDLNNISTEIAFRTFALQYMIK